MPIKNRKMSDDAHSSDANETQIAIIGLGYVGLPLAIQFVSAGLNVVGLDIDTAKIDALNNRTSYIGHIPKESIIELTQSGQFHPTSDFKDLESCDGILLCVPTPLDQHREPDLSYVLQTAKDLAPHHQNKGQSSAWSRPPIPARQTENFAKRSKLLQTRRQAEISTSPTPLRGKTPVIPTAK